MTGEYSYMLTDFLQYIRHYVNIISKFNKKFILKYVQKIFVMI